MNKVEATIYFIREFVTLPALLDPIVHLKINLHTGQPLEGYLHHPFINFQSNLLNKEKERKPNHIPNSNMIYRFIHAMSCLVFL
jgi:hypothetical protein